MNYSDLILESTPVVLSSELRVLEFVASSPSTFAIKLGETTLLSQTYTPDADDKIYIYDIDKLVELALTAPVDEFTFVWNGEECVKRVLFCNSSISMPTQFFCLYKFLSPCFDRRITSPSRTEKLYFFNILNLQTKIHVYATYYNDGVVSTKEFESWSDYGPIEEIDVSPANYIDNSLGRLVQYKIKVLEREMVYNVERDKPDTICFMYKNMFGLNEYIYFTGVIESDSLITRHQATIHGVTEVYDIEEEQIFSVRTGPMTWSMHPLVIDLCRSKSIKIFDKNAYSVYQSFFPIIITDCDLKTNNADNTIADFEIKFKYAKDKPHHIVVPFGPDSVFDKTFDDTFN